MKGITTRVFCYVKMVKTGDCQFNNISDYVISGTVTIYLSHRIISNGNRPQLIFSLNIFCHAGGKIFV